jgi:cephalosporin hydroxylase
LKNTTEKTESELLIDILNKHNINGFHKKGGTDKATWHSYTGAYERLLSPYINKKSNLLEVGIQYGGSALLWQEFLSLSNLYLIDNKDIMDKNIKNKLDYNRCKIYKMDAYSNYAINILKKDNPDGFDIIIDDGPHTVESQMIFIKKYFPLLIEGGTLIIEDIQQIYDIDILIRQFTSDYKNKVEIIDLRLFKNRYDDIMLVVRK